MRINIPKKDLIRLYYKEKKSKYKIGDIYNCSFKTVLNRMREYGMEPLPRSIIQSKYKKNNFSGNKTEKAYIVGFRLGDLNIYKTVDTSSVIIARCHTTDPSQVSLMEELFCKYGQVSVSVNKKSFHVNCFLNNSFNFLLPKEGIVDSSIVKTKKQSFAFAAGYVDAEGNVKVYDGRARFKIDSYDRGVIFWLFDLFLKNKIFCSSPRKIGDKGQIYNKKFGHKYNKDLWRIRVSEKKSLLKLLTTLKPYLKHKKRIRDVNKCLENIYDRTK